MNVQIPETPKWFNVLIEEIKKGEAKTESGPLPPALSHEEQTKPNL